MRPTFRLVPDFIVPNLNKLTYGIHLHWEDKENGSFKISRIHQSSEMWNEQCIEVYKAWSIKKKLWNASDPKKITKAKHRLITALRRNPEIEILKKESTFYRFRIAHQSNSEEVPTKEMKLSPIIKQNVEEYDKYFMKYKEIERCDMKNDPGIRDHKDFTLTNYSENNLNPLCKPVPQQEFYDVQKISSMPENIFDDENYTSEGNSMSFSDTCCCEILLDNYLCNQKCIWHGMPP